MIDLAEIAKWIGILGVVLTAIIKIAKPIIEILKKLNNHLEKADADEKGLRTLLKYRLTVISRRVLKRQGITVFEKAILTDGIDSYHRLGGNGEVATLVSEALLQRTVQDKYFEADDTESNLD